MKIVNLDEFRKLPSGTIFLKYEPCVFEDLQCKGETTDVDFYAANISYWPDCTGSDDFFYKFEDSQNCGVSVKMDFDSTGRDGCFEKDQLFAVYEKNDVEMLIDKLNRCLVQAY
jgi:hypothetical protein